MADHNIYAIFIMLLIFLESVDGSCQKHKCFTGHGQCVDTEKYLQADYVCACKKGYTGLYCLGKMPSCRRTCKKPLIKECIGLTDNTAVCICPKSRKPQLYGTEPHICFTEKALPNRQKICKRRRNKCDSGQQCVNYAQAPEHLLVVCQCPAGQLRGKMCKEEYAPADAGQGPCVDTGTAGTVCLCNKYGEEPGFCKPKPPSQKMTSSLGSVTEKETPKVASVSYRHRLIAATSNNGNEAVADIVSNEQKVNSGSYQSSVKQYDTSQTVRPPPKQSSTRKYIPTYKGNTDQAVDISIDEQDHKLSPLERYRNYQQCTSGPSKHTHNNKNRNNNYYVVETNDQQAGNNPNYRQGQYRPFKLCRPESKAMDMVNVGNQQKKEEKHYSHLAVKTLSRHKRNSRLSALERYKLSRLNQAGSSHRSQQTGSTHRSQQTGSSHRSQQTGSSHRSQQTGSSHRSQLTGSTHRSQQTGSTHRSQQTGSSIGGQQTGSSRSHGLSALERYQLSRLNQAGSSHRSQHTGSTRSQQTGSTHRSQQTGSSHRSQQTGRTHRMQLTGSTHRSQHTGSTHRSQQTGRSHSSQQTGSSRSSQPTGSSRSSQPTGSSIGNQQTGSSHGLSALERYRKYQQTKSSSSTGSVHGSQQTGSSHSIQQTGSSRSIQQTRSSSRHGLSALERYKLSRLNQAGSSHSSQQTGSSLSSQQTGSSGSSQPTGSSIGGQQTGSSRSHGLSALERYRKYQQSKSSSSNNLNTINSSNLNRTPSSSSVVTKTPSQQTGSSHGLSALERYRKYQQSNVVSNKIQDNVPQDMRISKPLEVQTKPTIKPVEDLTPPTFKPYTLNIWPLYTIFPNKQYGTTEQTTDFGVPNTLEDKGIDKIHDNLPQDKRISIPTDSDKPLSDTSVIPNADTETFAGTNPCYPNPCQNGGKCKSRPSNDGGYECDCPITFRGKFCHEVTLRCSVLGCDETKDCISLTCICVLNGVNSMCLTDVINPSEYNKRFNAISKSNKTGAETALIVVACIVVFLVIGIVHCSRVNTRRSTMQSTYQTAVRKGLTIDPVPGWCDVSSSVFKQTLCCKGDIVDTYKPKKEPKEKKSRKKKKDKDGKKKEEEVVLPDAIDSEINKRRQSNTGLHSNTNQSGNLSGNNTQNWKFSHRLLANKLLRKHSFADDDKLLLLEKNEKQKMSARYDRKMRKDYELQYLSKLSKHTKKNPNVLQMYKGSGDVHVKKDKSRKSVKLAGSTDFSGLKHSNSAKFRYNSERKQYVEKWLKSDINGACENDIENNELHTQHRIGELKKPKKSSRKSSDMVQPEETITRQSEHLQDDVPLLNNTTNYNESAESIENDEMYYIEDDQVVTTDRQKELMNTSLNNSNVNTNIGEQLYYVPQSPTYNMYSDTMKCGYSEDDMCYKYDHQSMHDYVTDHQTEEQSIDPLCTDVNQHTDTQACVQDPQNLIGEQFKSEIDTDNCILVEEPQQHDHLKIIVDSPTGDTTDAGLKNVQDDGDDISNGAVVSQQLLCSCESEVRNVYKSPNRELYGVWSTIVELPDTAKQSEQIEVHQTAVKKYDDRNNSQQETVQNLSPTGQLALSPTGQLDVSTDRHYLKSFVQNGQKLYYVDTESQVNFNQNHEMTNYSDTIMPCQNGAEDKIEQTDGDNKLSDTQRNDVGYDVDRGQNDRELGVIPNQVDGWYHEDDFDIPNDQQDYVIERERDRVNCEQYSERLPQSLQHDQDSYCQQNLSDDRYTSEYCGEPTASDGSLQNEHVDCDQNVIHKVNDGLFEQSNSVTPSQNVAEYMYDNNNSGVHIDVDGESDNEHDAKQSMEEHNEFEHFGEQSQSGNDKESCDITSGNNSMFIENCCEVQSQIDLIDSASDDSVDNFTSDISTLVPSATESEDYLSEDITLIAPDGTEV